MSDIEEEETQQRNSLEDAAILSNYSYLHFLRQQQQFSPPPQFSPNMQQQQQLSGSQQQFNLPPPSPSMCSSFQQQAESEPVASECTQQGNNLDSRRMSHSIIEQVRMYPCIWDVRCRSYKETPVKTQAWAKISSSLNKSRKYQIVY